MCFVGRVWWREKESGKEEKLGKGKVCFFGTLYMSGCQGGVSIMAHRRQSGSLLAYTDGVRLSYLSQLPDLGVNRRSGLGLLASFGLGILSEGT